MILSATVRTVNDDSSLREAASYYANFGLCVLPIRCGTKAPTVTWEDGLQQQRRRWNVLRQFRSRRVCGIATFAGGKHNLAFRDWDVPDAYHRWRERHPDLAAILPTTRTFRGHHVAFRLAGPGSLLKFADGELRPTANEYCLLPPSQHPDGGRYEIIVPWRHVSELPILDPVETHLIPPTPQTTQTRTPSKPTPSCSSPSVTIATLQVDNSEDGVLSGIIWTAVPQCAGQRHHRLFWLARRLKAMSEYAECHADDLEWILRQWHDMAVRSPMRTKDWDESWRDFRDSWDRVKYPAHGLTMARLREWVFDVVPLGCPCNRKEDDRLRLGLACEQLQLMAGDDAFPLSARVAGGLLGVSGKTASMHLRAMVESRELVLVEPAAKRLLLAARYRYRGGLMEILRKDTINS